MKKIEELYIYLKSLLVCKLHVDIFRLIADSSPQEWLQRLKKYFE